MGYTNAAVIRRFVRGETDGKCNRMAIAEGEGWTFLWGYGHALYAARSPDETLFIYDGWYGYSRTTSTHLNTLKNAAKQVYGEPRRDGQYLRVVVDGDGGGDITHRPPTGRDLIIVDRGQPGTSYGKLDTDRPELDAFEGRYVPSPSGYGG